MKILRLESENIKRIRAVTITPTGNLVQITGRNGSGKTSCLDSIWWALTSAKSIQAVPIRKGADSARIRLDLGELKVTRRFRKREDGSTAIEQLIVETADGARLKRPQDVVDSLIGALAFDPLAFARADPKQQFETLKALVPGVNFAAIEGQNQSDREARTEVGRTRDREKAAAASITVPEDTPTEPVDESALVAELEKAGQTNAEITERKARREQAVEVIAQKRQRADEMAAKAAALRREADSLEASATTEREQANTLQKRLDEAEALPPPVDTTAIRDRIAQARKVNGWVEARNRRDAHLKAAEAAEAAWKRLTEQIEQRIAEKEAAIAAAALPVEGLGFGDGVVLFNGLPFDQASDAEQLRVSCAIAMAGDPKLRVIRVRDGSLLDENGMRLLAELADKHDMQVWVESVDSSGKVGFVIEDGMLRDAAAAEPQGEAA